MLFERALGHLRNRFHFFYDIPWTNAGGVGFLVAKAKFPLATSIEFTPIVEGRIARLSISVSPLPLFSSGPVSPLPLDAHTDASECPLDLPASGNNINNNNITSNGAKVVPSGSANSGFILGAAITPKKTWRPQSG